MKLKTFQAKSMADALALVKRDLGASAVILHTRTFRRGGILGFGSRPVVEITAADDAHVTPRPRKTKKEQPAPPLDANHPANNAARLLQRAYAPAQSLNRQTSQAAAPDAVGELTSTRNGTDDRRFSGGGDSQLANELRELKQLVQRVARTTSTQHRADLPQPLFRQYLALLEQEVAEELADDVIGKVRQVLGNDLGDSRQLRRVTADAIAQLIPTDSPSPDRAGNCAPGVPRPGQGCPHIIALIGPTGVGKTTTVAKLAATFKLRDKLNVALATIDTYRIAAVDQLRTYAQIIGVPLHVAATPLELKRAIDQCKNYDVIIIDTAGRSQRDGDKLQQLKSFIEAADPHEVHLVLSSTAGQKVLMEAVHRFASIRTDRIIFTKLDEAVNFGVLLNVIRRVNKKLSYVTTGQEVPHHIERGEPDRLARLILGEPLPLTENRKLQTTNP